MSLLADWDRILFYLINGLGRPEFDDPMMFISSKYTWLALGLLFLAVAIWRRRLSLMHTAVLLGLTIGLADFVTFQIVKPWVARERPCRQLAQLRLVPQWCGGDFGFPSNHATNGMAMTTILALNAPIAVAVVACLLTLLTGFSRIYLGVHFPADVVAGLVFGVCIGLICHALYWYLQRRWSVWRRGRAL